MRPNKELNNILARISYFKNKRNKTKLNKTQLMLDLTISQPKNNVSYHYKMENHFPISLYVFFHVSIYQKTVLWLSAFGVSTAISNE